jgi:flagellar biosynthesis protein FlhB
VAEDTSSQEEKTEEPTQKRIDDAREEGNVPRSVELSSMMILLTGVLGLYFLGGDMWTDMSEASYFIFNNAVDLHLDTENFCAYAEVVVWFMVKLTAPLFAMLMVVGILTGVAQSGPNFSWKAMQPKASKMDPIKGLKRTFASTRALMEMVKSILKVAMVGGLAWWTIASMFGDYVMLLDKEVSQFFIYLMMQIFKLSIRIALLLLFLAVLDYIWQRYKHFKDLRMSLQEMKEERKQQEGDPMVKSKIRSIQMEAARKRMMADVQEADVVVTNPTHLAVAIKYDPDTMVAPLVVAKGARKVAEKIKEIAKEHGIPIVENKPLARLMFKICKVGGEVPSDMYKAIAEVLAYVYRLRKDKMPRNL